MSCLASPSQALNFWLCSLNSRGLKSSCPGIFLKCFSLIWLRTCKSTLPLSMGMLRMVNTLKTKAVKMYLFFNISLSNIDFFFIFKKGDELRLQSKFHKFSAYLEQVCCFSRIVVSFVGVQLKWNSKSPSCIYCCISLLLLLISKTWTPNFS